MKKSKLRIVKYSSGYKEAALELLSHLWMHLSKEDQKQLFEWRYERNPYSDNPHIYLAINENEVVAFRAFVVQPYVSSSTGRVLTFTPADTIVHRAYQGIGLFKVLNSAFFEDVHKSYGGKAVIFNLSSNEASTAANLRHGWQATNGIKRFALNFSLSNYFFTKMRVNRIKESVPVQTNKSLIEISSMPKPYEMAVCAEKYRNPDKLNHIRDTNYFKWRYACKKDNYIFFYHWQNVHLLAYLIIEKLSDTQYQLIEYFAKDAKTLKNTLQIVMKIQRIPFLRTWALSGDDTLLLKSCGFIPAPVKLWNMLGKKRLPVLVRPIKEHFHPHDLFLGNLDSRDINNWQFFIADRH